MFGMTVFGLPAKNLPRNACSVKGQMSILHNLIKWPVFLHTRSQKKDITSWQAANSGRKALFQQRAVVFLVTGFNSVTPRPILDMNRMKPSSHVRNKLINNR